MSVRAAKGPLGCLLAVVVVAFVSVMLTTIVTVGIWPGEAKLVAPILCPDDQPDPFVVADSYQPAPGETTYNFTMYCVGPRGDHTDVGFFRPLALLTLVHTLIVVALVVLAVVLVGSRHRRRHPPPPPTAAVGPADDVPAGGPIVG